jgi:hypothetical protein
MSGAAGAAETDFGSTVPLQPIVNRQSASAQATAVNEWGMERMSSRA